VWGWSACQGRFAHSKSAEGDQAWSSFEYRRPETKDPEPSNRMLGYRKTDPSLEEVPQLLVSEAYPEADCSSKGNLMSSSVSKPVVVGIPMFPRPCVGRRGPEAVHYQTFLLEARCTLVLRLLAGSSSLGGWLSTTTPLLTRAVFSRRRTLIGVGGTGARR